MNTLNLNKIESVQQLEDMFALYQQICKDKNIINSNIVYINDELKNAVKFRRLYYLKDGSQLLLFVDYAYFYKCYYISSDVHLNLDIENSGVLFNEFVDLKHNFESTKNNLLNFYSRNSIKLHALNYEMQISLNKDTTFLGEKDNKSKLEQCTNDDAQTINSLISGHLDPYALDVFPEEHSKEIDQGNYFCFRKNNEIACIIRCVQINASTIQLSRLVTDPKYRKLGLALEIMQSVMDNQRKNARRVSVWVNETNISSLNLVVEKFGFQIKRKACLQFVNNI